MFERTSEGLVAEVAGRSPWALPVSMAVHLLLIAALIAVSAMVVEKVNEGPRPIVLITAAPTPPLGPPPALPASGATPPASTTETREIDKLQLLEPQVTPETVAELEDFPLPEPPAEANGGGESSGIGVPGGDPSGVPAGSPDGTTSGVPGGDGPGTGAGTGPIV